MSKRPFKRYGRRYCSSLSYDDTRVLQIRSIRASRNFVKDKLPSWDSEDDDVYCESELSTTSVSSSSRGSAEQPKTQQNIMSMLKSAFESDQMQMSGLQNLLQHVASQLLLHTDLTHDPNLVKDIVELLHRAGVKSKEMWLDFIENTKMSPVFLPFIAKHFSGGSDGQITVTDGRIPAYAALLPHMSHVKLRIKISNCDATQLLPGLSRHTCTQVQVTGNPLKHLTFLTRIPTTRVLLDILENNQILTPLEDLLDHHTFTLVELPCLALNTNSSPSPDPFIRKLLTRLVVYGYFCTLSMLSYVLSLNWQRCTSPPHLIP